MKVIWFVFLMVTLLNCSSSKIVGLATQGDVSQEVFNQEIPFYYLGKHIYVDVEINDKIYAFLFDTGYDISMIDKKLLDKIEFAPLKKQRTTGSSFTDVRLEYGTMPSIGIGDVRFQYFGIGVQDLSHIKSPFLDGRKIYGIIGANILRKAYWQIDYKKQSIKFFSELENVPFSKEALSISMIPKSDSNWGLKRVRLAIGDEAANFVFDTGSYGSFTANKQFLEQLKNSGIELEEYLEDSQVSKQRFKLKELRLDKISLKDQVLTIEEDVDLLIGNDFLEEYVVTIDWFNNTLYLEPTTD